MCKENHTICNVYINLTQTMFGSCFTSCLLEGACLIYVNCVCVWVCAQWCPTYVVLCFSSVLFRLVYPKLSASLEYHFRIALWYSLTFSYRRLTFSQIVFGLHYESTHTININKTYALQLTTGKTGTNHSLCEIDVNNTNGEIFFTHHKQYYIDIHVQI